MNRKTLNVLLSNLTLIVFSLTPIALADEGAVMNAVKALEKQMGEMQKTINWQKEKIEAMERRGAGGETVVVSSGGSDFGDDFFDNNLKAAIGDSSKWLKDLKFSGDFRLRYEALNEQHNSAANDRNRLRYRLRFGFEKKMKGPFKGDEMKVGFRIVSAPGESVSPSITSTNTTFDTNFAYKDISIDRAYAIYMPEWAKVGPVKELEIGAGKFKNPFEEGSSWIVWDGDVTPEGVYEKIDMDLLKSDNLDASFSALAGQLVLEEGSGSQDDDAELWAYQFGLQSKIRGVTKKAIEMKNFFSWYNFDDFNLPGNFAGTGGNFTGPGNQSTRLTTGFDVMEFYNEIAVTVNPLPKTKFFFDWAKNVSENSLDGFGAGQDKAWAAGAKMGSAKKKGQWEVGYTYAWIEANAVPGVFSDSDFGGADRRGSVIKGAYALTDNLQLGAAAFFTNRILTGHPSRPDNERDLFQVDLVWKI